MRVGGLRRTGPRTAHSRRARTPPRNPAAVTYRTTGQAIRTGQSAGPAGRSTALATSCLANRYLTGTSARSPTLFVAVTVVPPARTRGLAPLAHRLNPPPGWPAVPDGFVPPPGWQPDPAWPPPPPGCHLWFPSAP